MPENAHDKGRFHEKKVARILDFVQMILILHFWSIKGVYFLQNTNNFNFKLFKLSKLWGGGRGNLDKIQKNEQLFFVKPSLTLVSTSLTHCCLVDLIDVTLACEDANSKLVGMLMVYLP